MIYTGYPFCVKSVYARKSDRGIFNRDGTTELVAAIQELD